MYPQQSSGISVQLVQSQLWQEFHSNNTEMIVTKVGRKLFPKLEVTVSGLAPHKTYGINMRLEQADDLKYRYSTSTWTSSRDDDNACFPTAPHIESNEGFSQLGDVWMQKAIEFSNCKITNNSDETGRGMILVQTLHKYVPVIYVYEMSPDVSYASPTCGLVHREILSLAEFITVTAYQNDVMKKLKVKYNPFAKGCRGHNASSQRSDEQKEQLRRKRSYSPETGSGTLLGHRSIEGAPASKMASPAFPNMATMMPSPAYGMPTVSQTTQHQTTNPFPSPPQENRTSPATVQPPTMPQFEFPPSAFPDPSLGYNPMMMMMNPFPFFPMTGMPPMDYSMFHNQQSFHHPSPYSVMLPSPQCSSSPNSSLPPFTPPASTGHSMAPIVPELDHKQYGDDTTLTNL